MEKEQWVSTTCPIHRGMLGQIQPMPLWPQLKKVPERNFFHSGSTHVLLSYPLMNTFLGEEFPLNSSWALQMKEEEKPLVVFLSPVLHIWVGGLRSHNWKGMASIASEGNNAFPPPKPMFILCTPPHLLWSWVMDKTVYKCHGLGGQWFSSCLSPLLGTGPTPVSNQTKKCFRHLITTGTANNRKTKSISTMPEEAPITW